MFNEMLTLCDNDKQRIILDRLMGTSKSSRALKSELIDILHISDRQVRNEISIMRRNGIPIASDVNTPGYYIPQSIEEYSEFARRYIHRANTLFIIEKKMRDNAFKLYSGQMKIGDK